MLGHAERLDGDAALLGRLDAEYDACGADEVDEEAARRLALRLGREASVRALLKGRWRCCC